MTGVHLKIYFKSFMKVPPFTKLMKKRVSFIWDNACQEAFEEIKEYLAYLTVLVAPISRKSFLLYV